MPTSGSTDWSITAGDVCTRAYRLIRKLGQGQTIPGELSTTGLTVLNGMLKAWQMKGLISTVLAEATFNLTDSTASYALATRALRIDNPRHRASNVDTPIMDITRDSYLQITNKAFEAAAPNRIYFDRQRTTTTAYVWPVPEATTGAIAFSYQRVIEDLDAVSDEIDLSQEMLLPTVYCLASLLADEFGVDDNFAARIIARAQQYEQDIATFNQFQMARLGVRRSHGLE
jgi:hypothetical protein